MCKGIFIKRIINHNGIVQSSRVRKLKYDKGRRAISNESGDLLSTASIFIQRESRHLSFTRKRLWPFILRLPWSATRCVSNTVFLPSMAEHGVRPCKGDVAEVAVEPASSAVRQRVHRVSLPVAIPHERRPTLAHPTPAPAAAALLHDLLVLRIHVSEARAHAPQRPHRLQVLLPSGTGQRRRRQRRGRGRGRCRALLRALYRAQDADPIRRTWTRRFAFRRLIRASL